jgi:uncharacterized membrane protein (DUF485 family)
MSVIAFFVAWLIFRVSFWGSVGIGCLVFVADLVLGWIIAGGMAVAERRSSR